MRSKQDFNDQEWTRSGALEAVRVPPTVGW